MFNILIVEDDVDISNMENDLLTQAGYSVSTAYSGTEAIMCIEKNTYSLVLLDLMLPGMSGEMVLEKIESISTTPVIAISAKDDKNTKINLLKSGADDYITKPFDTDELLARIEAVLRRNSISSDNYFGEKPLIFKDISLNRSTFEVTISGTPIILTKHEYLILELLMTNPKKVFTKNNIFESVWNEEFLGEDNTINVHISNIRNKLSKINPEGKYIQTVWGIGFKLEA
ncbi:MAG: response regulator transcription factor [Oscillospiraceae bacterium]